MNSTLSKLVAVALVVFLTSLPLYGQESAILSSYDLFHPAAGRDGMVVTQKAEATQIGLDVLRRGGNAVDAAVAVAFALAVVLPRAGNLGGGGFMMVYEAKTAGVAALDYREIAPSGAHRDLFLDPEGNVDTERARYSHLSTGVPGTVAGLAAAHERYGTMPLAELVAPAIELAEKGYPVTLSQAAALADRRERLARSPASAKIFLRQDGTPWTFGDTLVQNDLAASLRLIAETGPAAFYEGKIAERIVAEMKAHGGLITREDLRAYRPVWREAVRGTYRGYEVVSMPPPSSGGVHVIEMLNILEGYPLGYLGAGSAETIHLMAEAMRLAYADRATYLGDPEFYDVPVAALTSKAYAEELRRGIDRFRARPSSEIAAGDLAPYESTDTTHFSIVDRWGNAVANTYTLNFSFGSGIVAAGTGILLNNEMDDFSSKPGVPNAFGLVGGEANAIEAGKRPLSSMTPTFVFQDGKLFLVTGSPGGSQIITAVLQIILNVVDHGMNVAAASAAPRVHHQWLPDELVVEVGHSPDTLLLLTARGHRVKVDEAMGSTQTIELKDGLLFGAADPRRPDGLALGY